jgi:mevalonate kinase
MSEFDFDFGFTAVDENELEVVQKASKVAEKSSENYDHVQEKIDALYNAIIPLLNNLKKNPEKEYILWPNRVEKVDEFEDHLRGIYNS